MKKIALCLGILILMSIIIVVFYNLHYPLKYTDLINKYSIKYNLDNYLVASLINTESSFDTNAHSTADARGLMQIIPSTAKEVCQKLDIEYYIQKLYQPEYNISIGCYYLRYLLDLYNQDLFLALASYNAGMGHVNNYVRAGNYKYGEIDNFPFVVTVNYVHDIINDLSIYNKKLS